MNEQITKEEFEALAIRFGKQDPTELEACVKEFFEKYLNRTEESDGGKIFHPITISCCRALMLQPLNELLDKMAKLSGAEPRPTYDW
jgi:hypothetical protein